MKIVLSERFQRDLSALAEDRFSSVFASILSIPKALAEPHRHSGLGIRRLHQSGIWEARVGLGLRLVFSLDSNVLTLVRAGSHDDVRRYLREL
jgi:mRNA-degrading endonuclease YafQ of YafQ-DinJ toxin-antitoxin module